MQRRQLEPCISWPDQSVFLAGCVIFSVHFFNTYYITVGLFTMHSTKQKEGEKFIYILVYSYKIELLICA